MVVEVPLQNSGPEPAIAEQGVRLWIASPAWVRNVELVDNAVALFQAKSELADDRRVGQVQPVVGVVFMVGLVHHAGFSLLIAAVTRPRSWSNVSSSGHRILLRVSF